MSTSMVVQKSILLNASSEKTWIALTNPQLTKQYMYGCEVISDWEVGAAINWKGTTEDGQVITYVQGHIETIQIGKMVQFTMFDPNMGLADIPENYVSLTYLIEPKEGNTCLFSLTQGDYATVENGQQRYEETIQGWEQVLPIFKNLVEQL